MVKQWTPSTALKQKLLDLLKVGETDIETLCFQLEYFINETGMPSGNDGSCSRQIAEIAEKAEALVKCLTRFERENPQKFRWLDGFDLAKITRDDLNQESLKDFGGLHAYPTANASLMLKALIDRSAEYQLEVRNYNKLEPLTEALRDAFGWICYHNAKGEPLNHLSFSAAYRSYFVRYCEAVLEDYYEFNSKSAPSIETIKTAIKGSRWFQAHKYVNGGETSSK